MSGSVNSPVQQTSPKVPSAPANPANVGQTVGLNRRQQQVVQAFAQGGGQVTGRQSTGESSSNLGPNQGGAKPTMTQSVQGQRQNTGSSVQPGPSAQSQSNTNAANTVNNNTAAASAGAQAQPQSTKSQGQGQGAATQGQKPSAPPSVPATGNQIATTSAQQQGNISSTQQNSKRKSSKRKSSAAQSPHSTPTGQGAVAQGHGSGAQLSVALTGNQNATATGTQQVNISIQQSSKTINKGFRRDEPLYKILLDLHPEDKDRNRCVCKPLAIWQLATLTVPKLVILPAVFGKSFTKDTINTTSRRTKCCAKVTPCFAFACTTILGAAGSIYALVFLDGEAVGTSTKVVYSLGIGVATIPPILSSWSMYANYISSIRDPDYRQALRDKLPADDGGGRTALIRRAEKMGCGVLSLCKVIIPLIPSIIVVSGITDIEVTAPLAGFFIVAGCCLQAGENFVKVRLEERIDDIKNDINRMDNKHKSYKARGIPDLNISMINKTYEPYFGHSCTIV